MSVTSGFFNSLNGDRRYNAEQMSAIFDGIINDGVFMNIGTSFGVKATTENEITVGVGRAWFNSAWIYNDAILPLTADLSELILNRYDAVVIEVDHSDAVRKADIKIVKGTPASTPQVPTMVHTEYVNQYPLAYIYRAAGSSEIKQADIQNKIGTSDCPYVTGILKVQNIDNIVAQWQGEWEVWRSQWDQWMLLWNEWFEQQKTETDQETSLWMSQKKSEFETWFESLQVVLDGDVATNLGNAVVELQNRFSVLASERAVYEKMQDSNGDFILDSSNNPIEGRTVMGASMGESSGSGADIDLSEIMPEDIGAADRVHASQHGKDAADPITPAMIGAANDVHTHTWSDISGKPETYPPSAHQHTWSDITDPPANPTIESLGGVKKTGDRMTGELIVGPEVAAGDEDNVHTSINNEVISLRGYPSIFLRNKTNGDTNYVELDKGAGAKFTIEINYTGTIFGQHFDNDSTKFIFNMQPVDATYPIEIEDGKGGYSYVLTANQVSNYATLSYTEDAVNALLGVDEE